MPAAGQFYMLAAGEAGAGRSGRPYLPRAFSVAEAEAGADGVRLDFLLEASAPAPSGWPRSSRGRTLCVTGPLGPPVLVARRARAGRGRGDPRGRRDRDRAAGDPAPRSSPTAASPSGSCSASATARTRAGSTLFRCSELRLASEDGHSGHQGYVTDLLAVLLEGDDAAAAAVYACGPPAMLEAVRELCAERGVAGRAGDGDPMACGFGSCFGCAVPLAGGGYMRLCVDGPTVNAAEIESALIAGSGH